MCCKAKLRISMMLLQILCIDTIFVDLKILKREVETMYSEMILMTKSRKHNNYCVAGIDLETGKWIRLISDNNSIHYAVPAEDLIYEDGSQIEVLDVVRIKLVQNSPLYFQPENIIYDSGYYWTKLRTVTVSEVMALLVQAEDEHVFHNIDKRLEKSFVDKLTAKESYSLKYIYTEEAILYATKWEDRSNLKYTLSFKYNSNWYYHLSVTDDLFTQKFSEPGTYSLYNLGLVISLGEIYKRDGCHYKLIASIFTDV